MFLLELGSDVAAEMSDLEHQFSSCRTCYNACSAAVKMLAVSGIAMLARPTFNKLVQYKCQRLPKSIKKLDDSETGSQWLSNVLSRIVIAGR